MAREGRWLSRFTALLLAGYWVSPAQGQDAGATGGSAETTSTSHAAATSGESSATTSATTSAAPQTNATPPTVTTDTSAGDRATAEAEPSSATAAGQAAPREPSRPLERTLDKPGFARLRTVLRNVAPSSSQAPAPLGLGPKQALRGPERGPTRARTLGNVTVLSNVPSDPNTEPAENPPSFSEAAQAPQSTGGRAPVRVERQLQASQLATQPDADSAERPAPSEGWGGWLWGMAALAGGLLLPIGVLLSRSTRPRG